MIGWHWERSEKGGRNFDELSTVLGNSHNKTAANF